MYEFDFKTLLHTFRNHRGLLLRNTLLAAIFGVIVAFSIPKTYTSTVRMVAEAPKESSLSGNMSSLASLAGINMNNSQDAISPELYPDVVTTNQFLIQLLYTPVQTEQGVRHATLLDYIVTEGRTPWWTMAVKGAVKAIKSVFSSAPPRRLTGMQRINPERLTPEEEALVTAMKSSVECAVDDETGVITLSIHAQDPLVAKTVVDAAQHKLQDFITDYRTSKVRNDLRYYTKLSQQLHKKYKAAQQRYARYADAHFATSLAAYSTQETDLENEMQAAYTAYAQMKQQVGLAEGKVQERTPVFTTVEASDVANRATSPRKPLLLAAFLFLGFFGTSLWIYGKLLFFTHPDDSPTA